MSVSNVVLSFFESRGGLPGATPDEQLACLYLDAGVLDSMGLIEMIAHLEEQLGVQFSADDLQSLEFQSVRGLIGIAERLRGTT